MGSPFVRPGTVIFPSLHVTSTTTQVQLSSALMSHDSHMTRMVGWAQLMDEEMKGWAPIGVVAAIVPWNFPLMLLTWKVHCVCVFVRTEAFKVADKICTMHEIKSRCTEYNAI